MVVGKNGNRMLFVKLAPEAAQRAIELTWLPLEWTRALIRPKVDPDFCANCQKYGHLLKDCKA